MVFVYIFRNGNDVDEGDVFYNHLGFGIHFGLLEAHFGNMVGQAGHVIVAAGILAPGAVDPLIRQDFQAHFDVDIEDFPMNLAVTGPPNNVASAIHAMEAVNAELWELAEIQEREKTRGRCKPGGGGGGGDNGGGGSGGAPIEVGASQAPKKQTKTCHQEAAQERKSKEPFWIRGDICFRSDGQPCKKCWFLPGIYCKKDAPKPLETQDALKKTESKKAIPEAIEAKKDAPKPLEMQAVPKEIESKDAPKPLETQDALKKADPKEIESKNDAPKPLETQDALKKAVPKEIESKKDAPKPLETQDALKKDAPKPLETQAASKKFVPTDTKFKKAVPKDVIEATEEQVRDNGVMLEKMLEELIKVVRFSSYRDRGKLELECEDIIRKMGIQVAVENESEFARLKAWKAEVLEVFEKAEAATDLGEMKLRLKEAKNILIR